MKISDLSKITVTDIKSYLRSHDLESVKERLFSNPAPIICVLAVIITITAVFLAYRVHQDVVMTQKIEVNELRKRVEGVRGFENTQKQYRDFLAKVPEAISENKLIEMLSEIALARNVQIISFSPVSKKGNGYISLTNVEITIASENYADTIRFINDIENSPHSIRIGKWSGILKMPKKFLRRGGRQTVQDTIKKNYIEASIEIETVEFGNE